MNQQFKVFFGPDDPYGGSEPSVEARRWAVDRTNPACPFSKFIGNEAPVRKLQAAAFDALGKPDHLCRDLAFALFGPASSGKTTLARLYAETVELPFVEVSPKSLDSLDTLLEQVDTVLVRAGVGLVEIRDNFFILPPVVIFLDEVHALKGGIVSGLLKATEFNDAVLVTESGSTVNCYNACWMIATTDEGRLFDAFRTRFSPINLKYLAKKELAKIIRLANPDFSDEVCELVVHYTPRVPRKGLEFARYMRLVKAMDPGSTWADVARQVARDEGIDEFGMHEVHLRILRELAKAPVSRNRMPVVAGRKMEEVERFVMPWLLAETDDQPAMAAMSGRGYVITDAGRTELARRD